MKLLVLSDSHGALDGMKRVIEFEKPDRVFHLGDLERDAEALRTCYPELRITSVPGNCDWAHGPRCTGVAVIDGCRILYTHGHEHKVKLSLIHLRMAAMEQQVQVALYGHTHIPYCSYVNGIWFCNPGSCSREANYALVQLEDGVPTCSLHTL